jgi:Txe/YoeB family toxin of Txe-Axe toxin-antitoxin module
MAKKDFIPRKLYLKGDSLIDRYTHSLTSSFLNTYKVHKSKFEKEKRESEQYFFNYLTNRLIAWRDKIVKIENEYFNDMKESMQVKTKQEFLDKLSKEITDTKNPLVVNWKFLNTGIKYHNKAKAKLSIDYYKKVFLFIERRMQGYLDAYEKIIKDKKLEDIDFYNEQASKLKNVHHELLNIIKNWTLKSNRTEDTLRKEMNEFYERALITGTLSPLGWTVEPIILEVISSKLGDIDLVGKKYAGKKGNHTVVDLEIIREENKKRIGINVKSQKYYYTVTRTINESDLILSKEFSETSKRYLNYMRRNLTSLTNFAAHYDDEGGNKKKLLELYNVFFDYEKKVSYLYYLISALDGVRQEAESNKNIYSILVSYQGGFLWTSDLINSLLYELPAFLKNEEITFITATYSKDFVNKGELNTLYKNKKEIIKKYKRADDMMVVYQDLYDNAGKIETKSMIHSITYKVFMDRIKKSKK